MAIAVKEIQNLQDIIDRQNEMEQEIEALRQENAQLKETTAQTEAEIKELEIFRPLLGNIPVEYYRVQLRDSAVMKTLLGRMLILYGRRFKYDPEEATEADKKFARQCLNAVVLACIRYCVMQNSRWNDMVEHFLSG